MKSKYTIRILIGLMSVALAGIIVIQFLWIKNAIQLRQEQFDHTVNSALVHVSADLENRYGVHFITEKLHADSDSRVEVMKQDPGLYQFMISIDDEDNGKNERNVETTTDTDVSFVTVSSHDDKNYISTALENASHKDNNFKGSQVTMVNVKGRPGHKMTVYNGVYRGNTLAPLPPVPPTDPDNISQDRKLMNIVKDAADEYAMSKMKSKDICDVIDSPKICSALKREFAKQGLPQNFIFATYCVDGDTLMINKAASNNPLIDFLYKSPLLATDFIDSKSLLLLNFPQRYKYIFSSIAGMLALSLFFTIAIVSAFGFSLKVIFRQKKLSDITNDFINNMTHELKTPLATISLTADTLGLANVSGNAGMVNEYSGLIKNEVRKLSRHVDRILEAAVLEKNGAVNQELEPVSINQLIEDEIKIFVPIVQQKSGQIETSLTTESLLVQANKDLFRSAICNLLDNAVKYSNDAPQIKVSLCRIMGNSLLCVEDRGIGMSKVDQKLIFEKFYRAHTGNRHDVKGFGLGLSFVKTVVENLNGKVWVESEMGKGSKFFIELPLA